MHEDINYSYSFHQVVGADQLVPFCQCQRPKEDKAAFIVMVVLVHQTRPRLFHKNSSASL